MTGTRAILVTVVVLAIACAAVAADAPKAKPPQTPGAGAEQIAEWIRQMDADGSSARDEAVQKLIKAGAPTIEPVTKAVKGRSLEVTVRGVSVLKALSQSKDAKTAAAGRAALEKLAADKTHAAGREAAEALASTRPGGNWTRRGNGLVGGAIINAQAVAGGGGMQMSVRTVNGEKEIDVTENGGRKVKITEGKAGIVVTVTEKPEGDKKPQPKEYKAANAAELKKKHPEAHKLYEQYGKQQGVNIVMNLGGIAIGPAAARALPRRQPRIPAAGRSALDARKAAALIDKARAELKQATDKLQAQSKDGLDANALADLLKRIRAAESKLAEARKKLPK